MVSFKSATLRTDALPSTIHTCFEPHPSMTTNDQTPLSLDAHATNIPLGPLAVSFSKEADQSGTSFSLIPSGMEAAVVPPRVVDGIESEVLASMWRNRPGYKPETCVQLKLRGDPGPNAFAQGRTMRAGPACEALRFCEQKITEANDGESIVETIMTGTSAGGKVEVNFRLRHRPGTAYLLAETTCRNTGSRPITLEMLSSFNLDKLTPFHRGAAPERLRLHRFRSIWSLEGRHEAPLLEELHLERSWAGHGIFSERFGQVGSMPVRGFFPFAAVEDTEAGVLWGAQLAHPGSWQLEVFRRTDKASLSGGLADREFGHWWKAMQPDESFTTPTAILSCVKGSLEDLCHALLQAQEAAMPKTDVEADLPIIFNEWCASWGNPTHEDVVATADALAKTETRHLVIDDGWAERPGDDFQQNGDWIINGKAFPKGLKATCTAVRERGLIPGIWFEFEVCNEGSRAFSETEHHLDRDGMTLQIGNRRFWDFRDPWVVDFLSERLIRLLRENDFGYLKVDYNECLGIGCDERGADAPGSPGEGLRQHLEGVQAFFRKIRRELPGIVIENCSSGGHRLEPSMQALCDMGSFSDAHETVEIPIISANLHRLILPRQTQVWAVIKPEDSIQRIRYSLASTFLGRMVISGDVKHMDPAQMHELLEAQRLYRKAVPVIRKGRSRLYRKLNKAWRTPKGWQVAVRAGLGEAEGMLLVVAHRFGGESAQLQASLPQGNWSLKAALNPPADLSIAPESTTISFTSPSPYSGHVLLLEQVEAGRTMPAGPC